MEAAQNGTSVKPLQDTLKTIYPDSQYKDKLAIMDDEQLIEQGKLLSRGVPMGTPVFDGAREADVIDLLEKQVCHLQVRNGLLMAVQVTGSTGL